jgi:hypothetical protein
LNATVLPAGLVVGVAVKLAVGGVRRGEQLIADAVPAPPAHASATAAAVDSIRRVNRARRILEPH